MPSSKTPAKKTAKEAAYKLTVTMNGETHEVMTDDVSAAIAELTPDSLKTRVIFTVETGTKKATRQAFIQRARMIFRNKMYRDLLARTLTR